MYNYYENETHVSNSNLKELDYSLRGELLNYKALQPIFDFGNLVDYMITEPERVNSILRTIEGVKKPFSIEDFEKALRMRDAFLNDSFCMNIIKSMKPQKEVYRTIEIEYNHELFKFPGRCKYDEYSRPLSLDIKTTVATSKRGFEDYVIPFFDYDQQGAYYKKLGRVEEFMFVGINKTFKKFEKPKLFKVHLTKEMEKKGIYKYSRLAHQYKTLIL